MVDIMKMRKILLQSACAIVETMMVVWMIVILSFFLYQTRGSMNYFLSASPSFSSLDFSYYVSIFFGRPLLINEVYYEPLSLIMVSALFWTISGFVTGYMSKSYKLTILSTVIQFTSIVIVACNLSSIYNSLILPFNFSLVLASAVSSHYYREHGEMH